MFEDTACSVMSVMLLHAFINKIITLYKWHLFSTYVVFWNHKHRPTMEI
jgi:hypothetical protein